MQGQCCLDWMLRSIVVVPGGCNVVPTICYGTGGEGMDGDQRCEGGRGRDAVALSLLQVVVAGWGADRNVLCYGGSGHL